MNVLLYERSKLARNGVLLIVLAWILFTTHHLAFQMMSAFLAVASFRLLYIASTDLAAVRCDPDGLLVNILWPRKIAWSDYAGAAMVKKTTYAYFIIPVSTSRKLVFKTKRSNRFAGRPEIGFGMLDASEADAARAVAAIEMYAAGLSQAPAIETLEGASQASDPELRAARRMNAAKELQETAQKMRENLTTPPPSAVFGRPPRETTFGKRR